MPKYSYGRNKDPPLGWDEIEMPLQGLRQKWSAAHTAPREGRKKVEWKWDVKQCEWDMSRFIFDRRFCGPKNERISIELYDYLVENGYANRLLIAKWRKEGYRYLCCLDCIDERNFQFGTRCRCRVYHGGSEKFKCPTCGCTGCHNGDAQKRIAAEKTAQEEALLPVETETENPSISETFSSDQIEVKPDSQNGETVKIEESPSSSETTDESLDLPQNPQEKSE